MYAQTNTYSNMNASPNLYGTVDGAEYNRLLNDFIYQKQLFERAILVLQWYANFDNNYIYDAGDRAREALRHLKP